MEEFVHSRRDLLVVGVAFGLVVGLLALGFGLAAGMPASKSAFYHPLLQQSLAEDAKRSPNYNRALDLLDQTPVIDGHNDFPFSLREQVHNDLSQVDFASYLVVDPDWHEGNPSDHTDLQRLRAGRVGGQFWSAYFGCSSQYKDATQIFLEQVDVIKRLVNKYSDQMKFAQSAQDIRDSFESGHIASLVGMESGHAIDSRLGVLRMFYDLGVRADSSVSEQGVPGAEEGVEAVSGGLSVFGETLVQEMNRLGMMVDLAHVSADTMRDALRVSRAPVIFSHSSSRTVANHSRNVPDDVLKSVAENGGIVMVNFYTCFVIEDCETRNATIQDVIAHVNHIRDIAGVDHIGIGGDYNGVEEFPEGLEDTSKYPNLFAALMDGGEDFQPWSDSDLSKLASLNLLRVLEQVEAVRDSLRDEKGETPRQKWIPPADLMKAGADLSCRSDCRKLTHAYPGYQCDNN